MSDYSALVDAIVRRLVNDPTKVSVSSEKSGSGAIMITIATAADDVGRVIGRKGATINAIRLVAKAAAVKFGDKVDVDIA